MSDHLGQLSAMFGERVTRYSVPGSRAGVQVMEVEFASGQKLRTFGANVDEAWRKLLTIAEENGARPKVEQPTAATELEAIKARIADSEKLEWLVYEIFYANPIAFARKNLVIALQRHLRGEPLSTPEEEQLKLLDAMTVDDRAAWHRANNAKKLAERGVS